jgi:hypothetical protein
MRTQDNGDGRRFTDPDDPVNPSDAEEVDDEEFADDDAEDTDEEDPDDDDGA